MSGTELGRLMDAVTAQPPVDVDMAQIADRVRRHRHVVQRTAAVAAFAAVALVVGTSAALFTHRAPDGRPTSAPTAGVAVGSSWSHDHWGSLSWRTPPGWLPSAAYPDHSRPSNAFIDGPYIGTARLPVTSPSPRTVQGNGVLGSAGPTLPDNAVVAWFSYGLHDGTGVGAPGDFDSEPLKYLPSECAGYGATTTFHEVRHFGSNAQGSDLALDGCINAKDAAAYRAQLHAVLDSVRDSSYPAAPPTAASDTAVASSAAGSTSAPVFDQVQIALPAGWHSMAVPPVHHSSPPGSQAQLAMFSDQPLPDGCPQPDQGLDCTLSMGGASVLALMTGGESGNIEGDTGQFGPGNDDGTTAPSDARCPVGGGNWWTWQHLYGLRSHGYLVHITACITQQGLAAARERLATLSKAISVRNYPELGAGSSSHLILPSDAAYPRTLCAEMLGAETTAATVTVAEVRAYAVGPLAPAAPHAFSGLTSGRIAAWCWVRNAAKHSADAYAVFPGYPPVLMVQLGKQAVGAPLPTGIPALP